MTANAWWIPFSSLATRSARLFLCRLFLRLAASSRCTCSRLAWSEREDVGGALDLLIVAVVVICVLDARVLCTGGVFNLATVLGVCMAGSEAGTSGGGVGRHLHFGLELTTGKCAVGMAHPWK